MLMILRSIGGLDGMWCNQGTRGDFCPAHLTTFDFHGVSLRVLTGGTKADPWFIASDVCRVLGLLNTSNALRIMAPEERTNLDRKKVGMGPGAPVNAISESGLYKLVLRSDKPAARKFQDWVTKEVLPAIRKDGRYIVGEEKVRTMLYH